MITSLSTSGRFRSSIDRDLAADGTDHDAHLAPLLEHVDAEASGVLQRERHVQLELAFELGHLPFVPSANRRSSWTMPGGSPVLPRV